MNFINRLIQYRKSLNLNKKEMAARLDVLPSTYTMVENGDRKPSENFLTSLINVSGKSEKYWLYGTDLECVENKEEFNCTKESINRLINDGFITKELNLSDDVKDIILTALKADLKHLFLKKSK